MLGFRKIESLDRGAGFISTLHKARQPWKGKGETAEVGKPPEVFLLGRQRISAGLSQSYLCEALSLAVGPSLFWAFFACSMDRLTKRFIFCISIQKGEMKHEKNNCNDAGPADGHDPDRLR